PVRHLHDGGAQKQAPHSQASENGGPLQFAFDRDDRQVLSVHGNHLLPATTRRRTPAWIRPKACGSQSLRPTLFPMRKQSTGRRASRSPDVFRDLPRITAFARVVQRRSFTVAAKELGTSTSAISKIVAKLERQMGTRLLARSTRHVAPTEAGRALY